MEGNRHRRILIVDDETAICELLESVLARGGV